MNNMSNLKWRIEKEGIKEKKKNDIGKKNDWREEERRDVHFVIEQSEMKKKEASGLL